jgi:LmbE family N-acetylglucosaminyl deacetylase
MRILVISAHPDDEVLGCGGAIARWSTAGHELFVAILGEGFSARYRQSDMPEDSRREQERLYENSRNVSKFLGVKELFQFRYPDNRFDTVPLLEIVQCIESVLNKTRPHAVYTHHGGDLNIDHVITFRAAMTATRPLATCSVTELYTYEVPSASDWSFGCFTPSFKPNVFVDIRETIEAKITAMEMYDSETRPFPHPRSPEYLRANARRWGGVTGLPAAEAFELVRQIK